MVGWLLEDENPCVRYITLTQLLGVSPHSKEVTETRNKIPEWDPVRKILAKQKRDGGWDDGRTWYLPKYKSTVWQLLNACEFLLMHRLYKADHHGLKIIRDDYTKLRAPWLVAYDIEPAPRTSGSHSMPCSC